MTAPAEELRVVDIAAVLPALSGGGWRGAVREFLEHLLGLKKVSRHFAEAALAAEPLVVAPQAFRFTLDVEGVSETIPEHGPLMVMANHPFGGADAITLAALCVAKRPDLKVLANTAVARIPGWAERIYPLSILGERDAVRQNAKSLRAASEHLKAGGALMVFPAGEVAHWRNEAAAVVDGPWSPHVAALAQKTGAQVVLMRFFGHNPPWFHLLGGIHPFVRTALLPKVLASHIGGLVRCRARRAEAASAPALRQRMLEISE